MRASPKPNVSQNPTTAAVNCRSRQVARDPLDVELPDDGRHQACGAILAIAVCSAFWGALIALVLA